MGYVRNFCVFYTAVSFCQFSGGMNEMGYEEKLVLDILNRSSLGVRPSACINHCSNAVTVNITYNVIQILAFTQAEETLSISGWFTIVWYDPRLTWKKNEYANVSQVSLPSKALWLPDVGVMNGKSSKDFDFSSTAQSRIQVDDQGTIHWLHGAILDITCPLDVSYFPFDYQTCYLIITPWQSPLDHLVINPVQHGSAVDNSYLPNSNVSEWEINSVVFNWKVYKSQLNVRYQYISISINLKRQPLYFIVLVLVPFSMLSCLACLIFTLEDTGDRLSVALSLVLSMTMYVVIVSSNAPRSMRTIPVLGIYLLDQLGLLSVATILAVINNKLRGYRVYVSITNSQANFRCPETNDDSPIIELRRFASNKKEISATYYNSSPYQHQMNHSHLSNKLSDNTFQHHYQNFHANNSTNERDRFLRQNNRVTKSHKTDSNFDEQALLADSVLPPSQPNFTETNYVSDHETKPKVAVKKAIYRHTAAKLDHIELVLYLILSLINGVVCLIIMPRVGQKKPI